MPQGVVPRMAIEWGFLVLLAVGAGIADLRPALIVLVMAIGWALVVLVELLAWRARPTYVVTEAEPPPTGEPAPPPLQPEIPPVEELPVRAMGPSPPAGEATAVVPGREAGPASGEAMPVLDPADPYAAAPEQARLREADQRAVYRLEPLKPRPRRRWFGLAPPREGEGR